MAPPFSRIAFAGMDIPSASASSAPTTCWKRRPVDPAMRSKGASCVVSPTVSASCGAPAARIASLNFATTRMRAPAP